jgi:hypothetical protein
LEKWDMDRKAEITFAKEEGMEEERKRAHQEKLEMARSMKDAGESIEKIIKYTKLTQSEIDKL